MAHPPIATHRLVLLPALAIATPWSAASSALADTLDLIARGQADTDSAAPALEPEAADPAPGDVFLEFDVAGNWVSDVHFDNVVQGTSSLVGVRMKLDTGVAFDAGVGWTLVEGLTFKVSAGVSRNEVELVSAVFTDPVLIPGQSISFEIAGGGQLIQFPFMGTLHHDFALNDSLSIGLGGGVGVQYAWLTWGYPYGGLKSEGATSFRYELRADATVRLGDSMRLGAWVGYAGTTQADFGDGATAEAIHNMSVGLRIGIRF